MRWAGLGLSGQSLFAYFAFHQTSLAFVVLHSHDVAKRELDNELSVIKLNQLSTHSSYSQCIYACFSGWHLYTHGQTSYRHCLYSMSLCAQKSRSSAVSFAEIISSSVTSISGKFRKNQNIRYSDVLDLWHEKENNFFSHFSRDGDDRSRNLDPMPIPCCCQALIRVYNATRIHCPWLKVLIFSSEKDFFDGFENCVTEADGKTKAVNWAWSSIRKWDFEFWT